MKLMIDSKAIIPVIDKDESQLIFQRHCNYDRTNGGLTIDSLNDQKKIVESFIEDIKKNFTLDDLENTYFLFTSSNTTSSNDFKRCVETTNIAMSMIKSFLEENNVSINHIMNLNEGSNYNGLVHESKQLIEPQMFTDSTGYLEYLKEKHNGINVDFWIDFEEDLSKDKREELTSEGPDQIVERALRYINILKRYSNYFHMEYPNSRLIIWNGTHYDLISPLVKQKIMNFEKSDVVNVEYCGGISLLINDSNEISANINGVNYPFYSQDNKQLQRRF